MRTASTVTCTLMTYYGLVKAKDKKIYEFLNEPQKLYEKALVASDKPAKTTKAKLTINEKVDKTASNDVNSSKGAENGRERTTRLEDVPSGDRNGQRDSSTRLGSVQKLQSKKETREVDKINE